MSESYLRAHDFDVQLAGIVGGDPRNVRSEQLVHNGTAINYSGIGDTFIGTCEDGAITLRMPEAFASDVESLDLVLERDTELISVLFIHGELIGGIDVEGLFRPAKDYNVSENTPGWQTRG